jgi:hypothetical protein
MKDRNDICFGYMLNWV